MQFATSPRSTRKQTKARIQSAVLPVIELVEQRVLFSTTIAGWNFDSYVITASSSVGTLTPTPSTDATGTATAYSIGMQSTTSGGYLYPTANASPGPDSSNVLDGTGNNKPATEDNSSTGQTSGTDGTGINPAWRITGGWSDTAATGSQGAQFDVNTTGYSNVTMTFDIDASSTKAPAQFMIEYTTNVSATNPTWTNVSTISGGTSSNNGASDGISVLTNSSNSNIVDGSYFQFANNTDGLFWQNGESVTFPAAAADQSGFAVRIVNAATGTSLTTVNGATYGGSGNWRLDNVSIAGTAVDTNQPQVTTQPTIPSTVIAGSSVTLTAAASHYTSVQWYVQSAGTSGFNPIQNATSLSYTFTTSTSSADNGNEYEAIFTNSNITSGPNTATTNVLTLNDPQVAVTIPTNGNPSPQSVNPSGTATFTAAANGSPAPTVQWQSSPDNGGPNNTDWTNISNATSTTYSFTASVSNNGTYYRALFTNPASPNGVATSSAKLTVSGVSLADYNFNATESAGSAYTTLNSSSVPSGVSYAGATSATLQAVGMTLSGTTDKEDITQPGGTVNGSTTAYGWRVRGTGSGSNGDTNGWWTGAPQYSQGAEFDVNTTGYDVSTLNFDWFATTSGPRDLMVQYNLNTSNSSGWTNALSSPLVAVSNNWDGSTTPTDTVSLSGLPAGANNDPNFGLRLVSAYDPTYAAANGGANEYTTASSTNSAWTQISNTAGNWSFNNVQLVGSIAPSAPSIPTNGNPTNTTVTTGANATFTAIANGYPAPTATWQYEAPGSSTWTPLTSGFVDNQGATSDTSTLTIASTTQSETGYQYEAVFTNTSGSPATTAPATLTVDSIPVITTEPSSVGVNGGQSVTLTSVATGNPTPTPQWYVATPNGTGGFNSFNAINNATSPNYTFTPSEASGGDEYEVIYTNTVNGVISSATSTPAVVSVIGQPIAQWYFNSVLAAPDGGADTGGNNPAPTLDVVGTDSANPIGLANSYYGVPTTPEADTLPVQSTVNTSFSEYVWRLRGGESTSTTSGAGRPDGWSAQAPNYTQGSEFNVDTQGYSNVTLHFDWTQDGIDQMQPQYLDASGNWDNIGSPIVATGKDYVGISKTTTPTGITVSLQGIAYANDNPDLQVRLVSAYAASTQAPYVVDDNTGDPGLHGQYTVGLPGANDAEQLLVIPDGTSTTTFSFDGSGPSASVSLDSSNPSTTASNIQNALAGLSTIGAGNVVVSENPNQDLTGTQYVVTFTGSLANTSIPNLITNSAFNYYVTTGESSNTGSFTLTIHDTDGSTYPVTIPANDTPGDVQTLLQNSGAPNAANFTVASSGDAALVGGVSTVGYAINISADAGATLTGDGTNLSNPAALGVATAAQQYQFGGASTYATAYDGLESSDNGNEGSWEIGNISFNGYGANEGGIGIVSQPTSQTATATYPLTLSATAYSETPITGVQWEYSTSSAGTYTNVPASGTSFSDTSGTSFSSSAAPDYSSSYTFTPPTSWENSTYYFEAVFTNSSGGMQTTVPATIPVVAPVAPTLVNLPSSAGAEAGQDVVYYSAATGSPAPTVDWQLLSSNGTEIQDLSAAGTATARITNTSSTYNGQPETLSTLVYTTTASEIEAGDQVAAIYSNNAGSAGSYGTLTSDAVPMDVFSAETAITGWQFTNGEAGTYSSSPAPTTGTGTASIVGMTVSGSNDPNAAPASGYSGADGDITATAGTANPGFSENLFRVRGGPDVEVPIYGVSMSNGTATLTIASTAASNITPYSDILVTGSGAPSALASDLTNTDVNNNPIPYEITSINTSAGTTTYQGNTVSVGTIQYVVPGSTTNISYEPVTSSNLFAPTNGNNGSPGGGNPGSGGNGWSSAALSDTQGGQFSASTQGYNNIYVTMDWYSTKSGILDAQPQYTLNGTTWQNLGGTIQADGNDYYGANLDGTGDPIPLVFDLSGISGANNNPNLGVRLVSATNPTLVADGDANAYATASSTDASPGQWPAASGNWRIGNITFHGVPNWLSDASQAIYTPATNSLVVTGPATIISDPMSPDSIFGAGTNIPVAPDVTAESASATINVDPQLSQGSSPVSTDVHLGGVHLTDGASMQVASMNDENSDHVDNHNTLVIGAATGQATAPEFDIDGEHAITSATASGTTVTVTTNGGSYAVGDSVRIMQLTANFSDGSTQELDGSYTVTGLVTNGFTFTGPSTLAGTTPSLTSLSYGPAGTVFKDGADISAASASGLAVTLTVPGTYTVGQTISLAGVMASFDDGTTASLNGTYTVASLTTGGFTINVPTTLDPNSTNITGVTLGNTSTVNASTLDLQDNDLIVHGGDDGSNDLWAVQAAAAESRDAAPGGLLNGTWDGAGLASSTAQSVNTAAGIEQNILAVELNSDRLFGALTNWSVGGSSETLNSNDVLVKYTYNGDVNLDGMVDDTGVQIVNAYYLDGVKLTDPANPNQTATDDYAYGDLNGDGYVDDSDVQTINALYGYGDTTNPNDPGLAQL